ncbi:MAG: VWA domain-containing protein [Aquimonas sp.]|nr:VWA domain-containing protein [Aquimonas sp.]
MNVNALIELWASLEWARPWAWLALPLPLLLWGLLPSAAVAHGSVLRLPFATTANLVGSLPRRHWGRLALAAGCWMLLCAGAAQPQRLGEVSAPPSTGRDLMLAVDTSGSMAIEDMQIGGRRVDRFTAVRHVVGDFLERREGDRLGLLLFGQNAYLLVPLTFDRSHVRYQLETSVIGMAGRETAIGDAIGLGVKRLRERQSDGERVLVLLTDGVNNAGVLDPLQAARLAAAEGVRVHTIGMGGDGGSTRVFGLQVATPGGEIDDAGLTEIARLTGGRYFRARDTRDLANIYAELDRLEPVDQRAPPQRPREELYPWPLGVALMLGLLLAAPLPRRRPA